MISWKEYEEILSHLTPEQRQAVLERDSELHKENLKAQSKMEGKQKELSLLALIPISAIYSGLTSGSIIQFVLYFVILYVAALLLFMLSFSAFEKLLGDSPSKAKYSAVVLSVILISGLFGIVLTQKLGFHK